MLHLLFPGAVWTKTADNSKVDHLIQYFFSEILFTSYQCVKRTSFI
jgi:hypothetical protein